MKYVVASKTLLKIECNRTAGYRLRHSTEPKFDSDTVRLCRIVNRSQLRVAERDNQIIIKLELNSRCVYLSFTIINNAVQYG